MFNVNTAAFNIDISNAFVFHRTTNNHNDTCDVIFTDTMEGFTFIKNGDQVIMETYQQEELVSTKIYVNGVEHYEVNYTLQ